ncbi:MAG TPA: sulfatase-like hydrolase/transferase, partial [Hyphomicrobiales bacterium]|nr:sulfatase-like hydrolase/transferase [Hyphomicrobiales bacterium]
ALIFAAAVVLAVTAIQRRFDARTAVIASIWVAGWLFYSSLFSDLNAVIDGGYSMVRSLPFAVLALILLTIVAIRMNSTLINIINMVLNGIAVVIFVTPAWSAASYEWRNSAAREIYDADRAAAEMPEIAGATGTVSGVKTPPDIYHFIFDRYASETVLSRYYDHDNHAIGQFLKDRGFYLARGSNSNYLKTGHSVASTFYMDYLDLFADDSRLAPSDWHVIYKMLDDHRVARFLKNRGYDFIQFGSWWGGTFDNPVADENHPHGFSEFNMLYLRRTMLRPIFHILPDTDLTMRLDWDNAQCQRVTKQIEEIKAIGKREKPVYVFAHILVPHGPYNFTTDGRCLSQKESYERGELQGYLDQVDYANRIIEEVVTALQAEDREPPVILIQADEGPFPPRDYSVPWQEAPADELRIKTGILNAYYFPNRDYSRLSNDITPVNSYRVLFNTYFGTHLPMLPDRIFAFPNDFTLYEFHDVTAKIRGKDGRVTFGQNE